MKADLTRSTFDTRKHYRSVRMQQGRVQLDADWNEQQDIVAHRVEAETADILGPVAAPAAGTGFQLGAKGGTISIGQGHIYVEGVLCENDRSDVAIDTQPDLPVNACVLVSGVPSGLPAPDGTYLGLIHVWQRHLTALEDPQLREVALDGPDTATRVKTLWQVQVMRVGDGGLAFGCESASTAWDDLIEAPTGQLAARGEPAPATAKPCELAPDAGYRRLDNLLYRVEIHAAPGADPLFKWSHDNGAIEASWRGASPGAQANTVDISASSLGRDATLAIDNGHWVELFDDTTELMGLPGTLVQVLKAEGTTVTVDKTTATGSLLFADFPANPRVRRWDGWDSIKDATAASTDAGWITLEDGVQIRFSPAAGTYRNADYWMFPARTATHFFKAGVDWPVDGAGQSIPRLPDGVPHAYARLGVLRSAAGVWTEVSDCRPRFPALTELTEMQYVGGDAQVVLAAMAPGLTLPKPLEVGVSNGSLPVANAVVRFTVMTGVLGNGTKTQDVVTAADGVASCVWALDAAPANQYAEARLLEADAPVVGKYLPVRFSASIVDEEGSCLCTICVSAEQHAQQRPSLQQAIDKVIGLGGGTICLEAGIYEVAEPLVIRGAHDVVVRGMGALTQLVTSQEVIIVDGCAGVRLEDLVLASTTGDSDGFASLTLRDSQQVHLERLIWRVEEVETSAAMLLFGKVQDIHIRGSDLRGAVGITSTVPGQAVSAVAVSGLYVDDNILRCQLVGVGLLAEGGGVGIKVRRNQVSASAGLLVKAPAQSSLDLLVEGNAVEVTGVGIEVENVTLCAVDNDVVSVREAGAAKRSYGILAIAGGASRSGCRIAGNRIGAFLIGVLTLAQEGLTVISGNQVSACALGMGFSGGDALIEGNRVTGVTAPEGQPNTVAGLIVSQARSVRVTGNSLIDVAIDHTIQLEDSSAVGIWAAACERLQVSGNDLSGIGPLEGFDGVAIGVEVSAPFGEVDISDNRIRRDAGRRDPDQSAWLAIVMGGSQLARKARQFDKLFVAPNRSRVIAQFVGPRDDFEPPPAAAAFSRSCVSIRGNQVAARGRLQSVIVSSAETCDFSHNQCTRVGGNDAAVVQIESTTVIAAGNRVEAMGGPSMVLLTKVFTVLGNICGHSIVAGGAPLSSPWDVLNI